MGSFCELKAVIAPVSNTKMGSFCELKAFMYPLPIAKMLCMGLEENEIVWRATLGGCGKGKGIRSFPSGLGCVSVLECDCKGFLPALMWLPWAGAWGLLLQVSRAGQGLEVSVCMSHPLKG